MLKFKKHFFIVPALIICAMLLIPKMIFTAMAEESTADLFNYDRPLDVAVIIEYEHNDISFTITSPSGQKIDKSTDTDNITVFAGSTSTTVFIGGAESGQWTITYDTGSNDHITVRNVVQNSDFWITSFNTGTMTESSLPVTFKVSGDENTGYKYSIMAVTDRNTLNGKVLASGRSTVGEEVSADASLGELSTYDEYYLLLYVSYDNNGSEIFDYAYSDSFSYTNPKAPKPMEELDITILHDSKSIAADWSGGVNFEIRSVYVEYYLDDKLISAEEYPTSNGKSGFFTYDDESQTLLFKISKRNSSGIASELSEFSVAIVPDNSLKLSLPESGKTASDIWTFDYTDADNTEITLTVNDNEETRTLDGDGSDFIALPDTRNTVMITYTDKNGYVHNYNRIANISDVTPSLSLSHSLDGITTTNDFIIISGATNCTEVTVNGDKADVTDGIFTYTLELDKGENSVLIEASNGELGTSLTATITRESDGILSQDSIFSRLLPLIAGLLASVIGIILIIVLTKKRSIRKSDKAGGNTQSSGSYTNVNMPGSKPKKAGFMWLCIAVICRAATVGLWAWFIVRKVFENSVGYIRLAYEAFSKADAYLTFTVVVLVFAIVMTVASIGFTAVLVIVRMRKKRNNF